MNLEYKNRELASIYENQGYLRDALDMYAALDRDAGGEDPELRAACTRLENALADAEPPQVPASGRVARLLEQWLKLLIIEKRLAQFRKIRARLQ